MRVPNIKISSGEPGASTGSAAAVAVEIRRELNRIPEATVRLAAQPSGESQKLNFEVGQLVVVELSDERQKLVLFKGLVVRWILEDDAEEGSTLRLDLKDAAFRLTRSRKSTIFRRQTDRDAVRALVEEAKLRVGTLDFQEAVVHDEMVQFSASDWDFIALRADAQGLVVDVQDGEVSVRSPNPDQAPKPKARLQMRDADQGGNAELVFGTDELVALWSVEIELDGSVSWAELGARAWDPKKGVPKALESVKAPTGLGRVAEPLGGSSGELFHLSHVPDKEREAWVKSRVARSQQAAIRGRLAFAGRLDIQPAHWLGLDGLDDRFGSEALVSAVEHRVDHEGWRTELQLGLSDAPFARQPNIADVLAGGLLPPVQGLHLGVVKAFEKDPLGEHRVKVQLSNFESKDGAVWARMARPDAGKDRGWVFWPEAGDEVLVGFVHGDPRQPIILGSLHSAHAPPPPIVGPPNASNAQRALVSRSGTTVVLDDEKASVTIETSKKNRIVVDDAAQAITLADQHGNTITLDASGITLSAQNLHLEAKENVVIKGAQVDVK